MNPFKLGFAGFLVYLRYRYGGRMTYPYHPEDSTLAYGPHVMSMKDGKDWLKKLNQAGISELHLYWSFVTHYNRLRLTHVPNISDAQRQFVDYARELDMKVVAQIRWNPARESMPDLPANYPFPWWSGFVWLNQQDQGRFFDLMRSFCDRLKSSIQPDEVILANELAQGIHFRSSGWFALIRHVRNLDMKASCALNTWQPLKYDEAIWYLIHRVNLKKLTPALFSFLKLPFPGGKYLNYNRLLRPLPYWLNDLDSIGINSYHYPTFNQRNRRQIRRLYAPYGRAIRRMKLRFRPPLTCTETGLELESGVDRSLETATNWWLETLDFWFRGLGVNRLLIWEHDVPFFLKVVDKLGGLYQWTGKA